MRTNYSQVARVFFTPETLFPFIIGAIFLSVVGNSVTQILFKLFGDSVNAAFCILLGAILIFLIMLWLIKKRLEKMRSPQVSLDKQQPIKYRGLILLVSRLEPCKTAIAYHTPVLERCWLICSETTVDMAKELKQEFSQRKISGPIIEIGEPIIVNDVYDPIEFAQKVKGIYRNLPDGWNGEDIIADFTGMTALGSVGMALACLSSGHQLQYTPAELKDDGKPTGRSLMPIEIVLKPQSNNRGTQTIARG